MNRVHMVRMLASVKILTVSQYRIKLRLKSLLTRQPL